MRCLSSYWISFIAILALAAVPAHADYHYASHEGSDEYPYTSWETAAWLIQDAVDAAGSGDTIYVGEGTWSQVVQISSNNTALVGSGIGSTILENYEYDGTITFYGDSLLIKDFSFLADYNVYPNVAIVGYYNGYMQIEDNYFHGYGAAILANLGGCIRNNYFDLNRAALITVRIADSLIFEHNTISRNFDGSTITIDDLYSDGSQFHIRNNLFYAGWSQIRVLDLLPLVADTTYIYNNVFYKFIHLRGNAIGSFGNSHSNFIFYNNTIDGTSEWIGDYIRIAGIHSSRDSGPLTNNIVVDCDVGVWNEGDTPVEVEYSDVFNVEDYFEGNGYFGEGNIFSNPMFMDTLDFHLQAFSPAIDGGDPEIFDPDGSRSDMGAYGGPYGESYEYFDLPPRVPDSLHAEVSPQLDTIYISWLFNTEADFNRYQVHRDTVSGFEPTIFNMIAEPDTSVYIDTDFELCHSYYYRISAIDNQDNISEYSEELGVIFTDVEDRFDPNLPHSVALYQNYPNPFNQQTIIKYYLPDIGYQPAEVKLEIYDLLGRAVRTLVSENQYPGEYTVTWDGRNERGKELPSGVYFYRLFVSKIEFTKPKKLILMR